MRTRRFWFSIVVLLILGMVSPLVLSAETLDQAASTIIGDANRMLPQMEVNGQAYLLLEAAQKAAAAALLEEQQGNMQLAQQMINMAVQDYNAAVNMQSAHR